MADHQAGAEQMKQLKPEDATIGVITALPEEYAALYSVIECEEESSISGNSGAGSTYALSRVGDHIVAVALLVDMGNNAAAIRATTLKKHCPNVEHIIMTGIAGAVPHPAKPDDHVRLGDIVVSSRGGVIQYDNIKQTQDDIEYRNPPRPPSAVLLQAARLLEAKEKLGQYPWDDIIDEQIAKLGKGWKRPPVKADRLKDWEDSFPETKHPCDPKRQGRSGKPRVFLGLIASANVLLKDPVKRNTLRDKFKVKAIEMEGSGIADATWHDAIGYFIVRGTCDYCNPDKGDEWHNYAALIAAAYTRVLIEMLPGPQQSDTGDVSEAEKTPALSASVPNLTLSFGDGSDRLCYALHPLDAKSDWEISQMVMEERGRFPYKSTTQLRSMHDSIGDATFRGMGLAQSLDDMEEYNALLDRYFDEYKNYLLNQHSDVSLVDRLLILTLTLANTGTYPADEIEVIVETLGNNVPIVNATGVTSIPRRPTQPSSELSELRKRYENPSLGEAFNLILTQPKWDDSKSGVRLTYSMRSLKHMRQECLPPIYVLYDSYDEVESFMLQYSLHARNIPDLLSGQLFVDVKKKAVSVLEV